MKFPSASVIERLPWPVRALLGCASAVAAILLTHAIAPLRSFPLLLALPTVVLNCWFFGMVGGVACALADAFLVDAFLTQAQFHFSLGSAAPESLRLAVFLSVSILLGWIVRRLAQQRALLDNQDLQQRLALAHTERQVAQERARVSEELRDRDTLLRVALRANGMGVWLWDVKRGAVQWSDEMFRMAGLEPGSEEPSFEAWTRRIHPDDAQRVAEARQQTVETGKDYTERYRIVWPDGSIHWLESQGTCQFDEEGRVTRVHGVLWDVTDRKRTEEAMLRAEKLAVAGRLAASVAHEINNPLEAVGNLLYLVSLSDTMEAAQEHAEMALNQLMRVSQITQQMLKFHRQTGAPQETRLSDIVASVLALFHARLQAGRIHSDLRVKSEKSVACMPSEVQQIFANLVANAIDALPEEGRLVIKVRCSLDWRDYHTAGVRVTFSDSGTGMERAAMRHIFEPFFTTKTETGTGLGMWVVAQLVDRHRGHVRPWSTRRAGRSGTAVSVFLPCRTNLDSDEREDEKDAPYGEPILRAEGVSFLTTNS
ncbi:MAG TPA: PAS domain-containing protein [Terracidiphilus sp.]|nr:PAS domain-containing protein [Terracidiphilus sp.]